MRFLRDSIFINRRRLRDTIFINRRRLRDTIFINRRRLRDTIFITALFTVLMVTGIVIGLVVSAPQLSSMML